METVSTPLPCGDFEILENVLGYRFKNPNLCRRMLTTRSAQSDERYNLAKLEHRGDALIYDLVWDILNRRYPDASAKLMGDMRSALVSNKALNRLAARLFLLPFVRNGGAQALQFKTMADVMEAVIGAIFEDAGGYKGNGIKALLPFLEEIFALDVELTRFDDPAKSLGKHVAIMGGKVQYRYSYFSQKAHVKGYRICQAKCEIQNAPRISQPSTFGIAVARNNPPEKARRVAAALALLELFPNEYPSSLVFTPSVWEFPRTVDVWGSVVAKVAPSP
jgi:dsRNA-specific ribonuclease